MKRKRFKTKGGTVFYVTYYLVRINRRWVWVSIPESEN